MIQELEQRIAKAERTLKRISAAARRHQKQRRLAIIKTRLNKLKEDREGGNVSLCFGGRKLFRAQFHLEDNDYASFEDWLSDWRDARSRQFFVIGSKDETAGNQSCVASVADDGSIALRLRLPDALAGGGKHILMGGLRFGHGHEAIMAAIGRNFSNDNRDWQAINYRFLRDDKGWRVFATVALPGVPLVSHKDCGVIGIDINAGNLAVTETDRYGNAVEYFSVPCVTCGKTSGQRMAIVGDAVKQVISFAVSRGKAVVIERLDFQKKKAALEKESAKFARMLSGLAYSQIQAIIRARAFDAGIEVIEVNPAYTSVIGRYKFKNRYGMSSHNAAALVIGRRSSGFAETLPSQLHITLSRPEDRHRHVWSKWAAVSRRASAALAAHGGGRATDPRRHLSLIRHGL